MTNMEDQVESVSETPTDEQVESVQRMLDFSADITQVNMKALLTSVLHKKGNSLFVGLERLRVMKDFNPRVRTKALEQHIRSLADSMKEVGFKESKPLSCVSGYEGKRAVIYVTDGHCRFEAVQLAISEGAPIQWIPIVIEERTTTIEDLTVSLVRSNSGKELTVLEKAVVIKRLSAFRWSARQIAEKLGFTVSYVNSLLMLSGAPSKIRQMIQDGEVTAAVAVETMRQHGSEAAQVLTDAVQTAQKEGKTRASRQHLPGRAYSQAVKKAAPQMADIVRKIAQDSAFASLPAALKDQINQLIDTINKAKEAEAPADDGETVEKSAI